MNQLVLHYKGRKLKSRSCSSWCPRQSTYFRPRYEEKNIPENEHENFNNISQEAQERPINNGDVHNNSEEIQETEGSIEELKEKTSFEEILEQRFNRLQKLYKSEKSRIALKKSLIAANKRNKKLQQEVPSNKLKESLSCILNEDQIKLLTREYKRMPR
ncbi:hypothetical protein DBV15_12884 [Temnothorax longispinosus]|uniref:Uncharacterized protein n=1 Tax=Temnothorax longispinosus TaxID=300112 RepID=A0A4V3S7D3_9HYME|nr:hypothetical protein DBV15_12884 [Temnothorax longispinosus]